MSRNDKKSYNINIKWEKHIKRNFKRLNFINSKKNLNFFANMPAAANDEGFEIEARSFMGKKNEIVNVIDYNTKKNLKKH